MPATVYKENPHLVPYYTIGNDLISRHSPATAQTSYYHYDALGSTRQLTDESGRVTTTYIYEAFGSVIAQSGDDNPYTFTGEQFDERTGLLFLRARYYDSSIGRFVSRDPWWGFVRSPQSLHPYVYVNNNPVNRIDPLGLFFPPCSYPPTINPPSDCDGIMDWVQLPSGECAWICIILPKPKPRDGCPSDDGNGGGDGGRDGGGGGGPLNPCEKFRRKPTLSFCQDCCQYMFGWLPPPFHHILEACLIDCFTYPPP